MDWGVGATHWCTQKLMHRHKNNSYSNLCMVSCHRHFQVAWTNKDNNDLLFFIRVQKCYLRWHTYYKWKSTSLELYNRVFVPSCTKDQFRIFQYAYHMDPPTWVVCRLSNKDTFMNFMSDQWSFNYMMFHSEKMAI